MARTTTPPDGRELVDKHFPYDGPHSYESVLQAAKAVDELVRYIANATGPGNGQQTLEHGACTYRVLGHISSAVGGLDQVIDQFADATRRAGKDPLSYDDRRNRPASQTTDEVVGELVAARKLLFQEWPSKVTTVHSHLAAALGHASHLGHNS